MSYAATMDINFWPQDKGFVAKRPPATTGPSQLDFNGPCGRRRVTMRSASIAIVTATAITAFMGISAAAEENQYGSGRHQGSTKSRPFAAPAIALITCR